MTATYTNVTDSVLQICVSGKDNLPKISQIKVSEVQEPIQLKTPGFRSCEYNPLSRKATVRFMLAADSRKVEITVANSVSGDINSKVTYTINDNVAEIDFTSADNGVYTAVLVVNNKPCDSINILVK